MDTPRIHIPNIERFLVFSLLILSLLAFIRVGFLARDLSIHEDEYQHTHLAWNALNGKVIYRDFEDSHGPLSNFWYAGLLKLFSLDGELVQSFYRLRYFNLLVVLLTAFILIGNIKLLTGRISAGLLGAIIYLLSPAVAAVSFRIRPDCYVALFSALSLFCWLKNKPMLMGLSLGLCLGFHTKFLPINFIILLSSIFLKKNKKDCLKIILGEILVIIPIALWFWTHQALSSALDWTIKMGFKMAYKRAIVNGDFNRLFRSAERTEVWLMILVSIIVFILALRFLRSRRISRDPNWWMSGCYLLASLLFLLAPVWGHALVFVVPLGLTFLISGLFVFPKVMAFLSLPLLIGLGFLFFQDPRQTDRSKTLLSGQLKSLESAIKETKRTDPFFYVWTSRCPAYVFNSDSSRFWMHRLKRANRSQPIRQLPPINYLAIHPMFLPALDQDEREYIQEHFQADGCFWKRIK